MVLCKVTLTKPQTIRQQDNSQNLQHPHQHPTAIRIPVQQEAQPQLGCQASNPQSVTTMTFKSILPEIARTLFDNVHIFWAKHGSQQLFQIENLLRNKRQRSFGLNSPPSTSTVIIYICVSRQKRLITGCFVIRIKERKIGSVTFFIWSIFYIKKCIRS